MTPGCTMDRVLCCRDQSREHEGMKHRYWVDWEDPDFPHIRLIESATKDEEPLRLGQAKARIIEHFEHEIKHAKDQIRRVRLLRIADVDRWEQRQNRR